MSEAIVAVNGVTLSEGQTMSVRVAVSSMLMDLAEPEHMADLGPIGPLYQARLREVEKLLVSGGRP